MALKVENQKCYGLIELVNFMKKLFKSLLKKYETDLYSTHSDPKAFLEIFNRTLLHIINKPMFVNGDGNWVNL